MESLPLALPDLASGLLRSDRGTAEPLASQPGASGGAPGRLPFGALLLTAQRPGGDALPPGGNDLPPPGERTDAESPASLWPPPLAALPWLLPAAPAMTDAATADGGRAAAPPASDGRPAAPASIPLQILWAALPPTAPPAGPAPPPVPAPAPAESSSVEPPGAEPPSAARAEARVDPPRLELASDLRGRDLERLVAWLRPSAAGAGTEPAPQRSRVPAIEDLDAAAQALPPEVRQAVAVRAAEVTLVPLAGDARRPPLFEPQRAAFSEAIAAVSDAGAAREPAASNAAAASPLPASQPPAAANTAASPTLVSAGVVDAAAPRWQEALASRIQFMVDHDAGEARLRLNPLELGALDIKIAVHEDKTYVQLGAASAAARDELTQSLPRLRELLSLGGLNLGGATVSDGGHGRQPAAEATVPGAWAAAADVMPETVPLVQPPRRPTGIDLYA